MRAVLLFLLTLSIVTSELTCQTSEVYVKFSKQNGEYFSSEEHFKVYSGDKLLKTSPQFSSNELRVMEYCLEASTNNQYRIELLDDYGDSWYDGSWLKAEGIYGNVVFRNYMTDGSSEEYPLSLYYALLKGQTWKVTYGLIEIDATWYTKEYSAPGWLDSDLSNPTDVTSSSQYFRKTFTGIADMAAYEVQMNYKYGIIAYINGNEVFRDFMPEGAVTPTTSATGAYQTHGYHGFIRPAVEIEATANNLLAVEIHFYGVEETSITFDAFIAMIAPSVPDTKCFIYGYDTTITALTGTAPSNIFNFNREDYYSTTPMSLPVQVNYEFTVARPLVNGIRLWSYHYNTSPTSFKLQGAMDSTSTTWTDIISFQKADIESQEYYMNYGYFKTDLYKAYRLRILDINGDYDVKAYEIQPLICSISVPDTIEFESNTYSYYAKYENVIIAPKIKEFFNCTVSPALPEGLTLTASTCSIQGRVMTASPATTYTMSSTISGKTYTGTFSLEISECAGTLVQILRTYKTSAAFEAFVIKDDVSQETVLEVAVNSGQAYNEDVTYIRCLTGTKYVITVSSSIEYWHSSSYIYIRAMFADNDYETIIRARYDSKLGIRNTFNFNAQYNIKPISQWYYKMGEVPSNWYNSETAGWTQGTMGSYPESSNQIQLYKQTFNIATLHKASGLVISLRYKYGCIIYLNDHEVFRNGVTGELSTSSMAETVYNDVRYRQISLPIKTMAIGETPAVDYIVQGTNTIAIALVAINANQKASVFDGAIRLMAEGSLSRNFDYVTTGSSAYGNTEAFADLYYNNMIYYYDCTDNYLDITFNNDRREWISSITVYLFYSQGDAFPGQFTVKARNSNSEEWNTLKVVSNLSWSLVGQHKRIWLENNNPYNQYRLENIASGNPDDCEWELGSIDFSSDCTTVDMPQLTYPANIEVYKNIEMGEVYANSDYYFDFTVSPALPEGITLDYNTGMISGTATEEKPASAYTITAKKFGSGTATATINFSVGICTGGKGLITLVARTDYYPNEASYKVHKGKGTSGEVVASIDFFKAGNALNYGDFCLPHDIYTLELLDSGADGWSTEAGYYLTVDLGEMVIETGQFPSQTQSITTLFTTNIPFQTEYSQWKLFNSSDDVDNNWKAIDFDDSAWIVKKAAEFGPHVSTTAYLRYEVNIPDIAQYYVMNIRMKYAGGVVVYFNGRIVARFNLEENFDAFTEATTTHDPSLFSKFHIILSTVGAVSGKNIIAFEIHRNKAESNIIFDATGTFGINDCSVVVDTYSKVEGDCSVDKGEELLDLKPQTSGYIDNFSGAKFDWVVENLEGSKFNSFGIHPRSTASGLGFSVYGRWKAEEEYVSAIAVIDQAIQSKRRNTWPMDVGIAGFKEFRYQIDKPSDNYIFFYSLVTEYCKPTGTNVCEGIGDYPAVGEGQISPSYCPEGKRGYSYRECKDGKLGDVKNDKCVYKLPDKLAYDKENYIFVMGTQSSSGEPSHLNIIENYYVQDGVALPAGLSLNEKTGEISGVPTAVIDAQIFTIRGANPVGETVTTVSISVRKGVCAPEGVFERTEVGETFVYDCALQGSYVGTQKRTCMLGKKDGEWQKATGYCMPVMAIVIIVVVVVIITAVAILLVLRSRKTKAVGGVKGKNAKSTKSKASSKQMKKTTSKAVKV